MFDLTVITVVKNDNQNILNTVNSVLKQKNCKFEYIICDGNSSDTTINRLKKNITVKKLIFFVKKIRIYMMQLTNVLRNQKVIIFF